LTVWYAGTAFATVLATSIFLYFGLIQNFDQEDDDSLRERASACFHAWPDLSRLQQEVNRDGQGPFPHIYLRILKGAHAIAETPGMSSRLPIGLFPPVRDSQPLPSRGIDLQADGRAYRALTLMSASPEKLFVQVALDREDDRQLLMRYRARLSSALAAALLFSIFAGHRMARRGLRPLAEITATARQIGMTNLSARIHLRKLPAEIAALVVTFNDMLARLEESFGRLSRFSADIAHELRTPIQTLQGEAEVALRKSRSPSEYRDVLETCLEECGRLSRITNGLLFLARAETSNVRIQPEEIAIIDEFRTVQEFYEAAVEEAGVNLTFESPENLHGRLDRTLFHRALCNLIENALRYTPSRGQVTVRAWEQEGALCITITDTGSGIAAEHLPKIFERFYRADPARASNSGGAGLGLALVQSIVQLHGGSVEIESQLGKGTTVTLSFPLA